MNTHPFLQKSILAVVICLLVITFSAFGRHILLDKKMQPNPILPEAYAKAIEALGTEAKDFYCLSADAEMLSETEGPTEWHLRFYSKSGKYREVIVPTKGKVKIYNEELHVY